ncbi:hypothetical protein [Pyxidicoccus sp. MSG2]|uniref:hypothetical protein n=1 Tax=Pyxidicoccus sp. MSG2 TaxID=2996790 RepID=UPI00226FE15D|nr:hypothetical protein [Pyxidicoccus sp. MSG2]MCY1023954.1 hypothetical protein [Pyxidicoccus sp. MSG2]
MAKVNVELTEEQLVTLRERSAVVGSTPLAIVEAANDVAFFFDLPLNQCAVLDEDRKRMAGDEGRIPSRREYTRSVISRRYVNLASSGRKLPKPLPPRTLAPDDPASESGRTTVNVPMRLKRFVDERVKELGHTKHVLTAAVDDVGSYFGSPPDQRRVLEGERAALSQQLGEELSHREHIRIILSEWVVTLTSEGGAGRT